MDDRILEAEPVPSQGVVVDPVGDAMKVQQQVQQPAPKPDAKAPGFTNSKAFIIIPIVLIIIIVMAGYFLLSHGNAFASTTITTTTQATTTLNLTSTIAGVAQNSINAS
ncbi:MAG: hypothetical protein KGH94_02275 [Candidatus Micrarchaeota archaeon]|nr:hypothetical protein [Candidatus Micrarchaeota archaeon]